jgi:hypothetical protein
MYKIKGDLMKEPVCLTLDHEIIAKADEIKGLASRSITINEIIKAGFEAKGIKLEA